MSLQFYCQCDAISKFVTNEPKIQQIFGPIELKFGTGINNWLLILNFNLKIKKKVHFEERNNFSLYFFASFR